MVKPVATVHVIPNLPEPLTRLRELAYNLRWSWDHDTIGLFRRLDRDLWETTGHNPVWMLGLIDQTPPGSALRRPGVYGAVPPRLPRLRRLHERDRHLVRAASRQSRQAVHRLFFDGIRADRVPAKLLRRSRRPQRRPPQERQRSRHSAGRRRAALSGRLLPPVPERRRLPAGIVPDQRLFEPAGDAPDATRTASR